MDRPTYYGVYGNDYPHDDRSARVDTYGRQQQHPPQQQRQRVDIWRLNIDSPPIHKVFIRNLDSKISEDDLRDLASEYGDIQNCFSLASKRGLGFVTFYDCRDAKKCVDGLEGRIIRGRDVHTSYAFGRGDTRNSNSICATITVTASEKLDLNEVRAAFSKFGDIKDCFEQTENPNAYTVKYYDIRHCERAVSESAEINGQKLCVELNFKDDDDHASENKEPDPSERPDRKLPQRNQSRRDYDDRRRDYPRDRPPYDPYGYPPMHGYPPAYPSYPGYGYPPYPYAPYPPYGVPPPPPGAGVPPPPAPPMNPDVDMRAADKQYTDSYGMPPQTGAPPPPPPPMGAYPPYGMPGQAPPPPPPPPPPPADSGHSDSERLMSLRKLIDGA